MTFDQVIEKSMSQDKIQRELLDALGKSNDPKKLIVAQLGGIFSEMKRQTIFLRFIAEKLNEGRA